MTRLLNILVAFIGLGFFSQTDVVAQHSYIPIPTDSSTWVTVVEDWHEGQPYQPHTFYYLTGHTRRIDTIILGKKYFVYIGDGIPFSPLPNPLYALHGAWMRNDTVAKKVYYIRNKSLPQIEELLYDFSLQEGDTVTDSNHSYFSPARLYPGKIWVSKKDSVLLGDGRWHYRWSFESNYGNPGNYANAVQIEGVGYLAGFFDDPLRRYHPIVSLTKELTCFRSNNIWLYKKPNPWNADCDTMITRNVVGVKSFSERERESNLFYPNPLTPNRTVFFSDKMRSRYEEFTLEIFDVLGRLRLKKNVSPGIAISLEKYDFESGIYVFKVTNSKTNFIQIQKLYFQ